MGDAGSVTEDTGSPARGLADLLQYPLLSAISGRRTRRMIRLGDKLTVQVAKVDTFKKQVDFRLAEDPKPSTRPPARRSFAKPPVGRWSGPWRGWARSR